MGWLGILTVQPDVRILCNYQKQCGAGVFNEIGKCYDKTFREKVRTVNAYIICI